MLKNYFNKTHKDERNDIKYILWSRKGLTGNILAKEFGCYRIPLRVTIQRLANGGCLK